MSDLDELLADLDDGEPQDRGGNKPGQQRLGKRPTPPTGSGGGDNDMSMRLAELQKQRQLDYLASRALRRMLSVDLAWGWSKWAGWCVDQRQLRFAVRRWVRMGVGRCLTTWAEVANRRAQQTRLLRTGVSRISRPRLSACMALWRRDWEAHLINGGVKSRMDELQAALDDARALAERLERAAAKASLPYLAKLCGRCSVTPAS